MPVVAEFVAVRGSVACRSYVRPFFADDRGLMVGGG
jgi:hypothetical protein